MPAVSEDLALARRLDWRFLLPDPRLGRVAYVGPPGGTLPRALRRFAEVVVNPDAADGNGRSAAGTVDLAVVATNELDDLRRARRLLRPGGRLYWEIDRTGRRSRAPASGFLKDPGAAVRSLGLLDPRIHWHHPDLERPRMLLPPVPEAVRYALGRRSSRGGLLGRLASLVAGGSILARLLPKLSVLAREPEAGESGEGASRKRESGDRSRGRSIGRPGEGAAGDAPAAARLTGFRGPCVLLTPRFRASRHVVTVLLEPGTARPVAVAKTARLPGERASLGREARALRSAAAHPAPGSVPRVVELGAAGGHSTLVQTGVGTRLLTPALIRRDPGRWTEAVSEWITGLHRATRSSSDPREAYRRWIEEPIRRIEAAGVLAGGAGETGETLPERTRRLTRPLARMRLPAVLEHGDVSCPNIVLSPTGRIGVVDWEMADPSGIPGSDLFFFLAFAASSRERAESDDAAVEAFRSAFCGSAPESLPRLRRYWKALALPAEAHAPLFVACWCRYVAGLVRRVGPGAGDRLEGTRYVRFWDEACGWAEARASAEVHRIPDDHHPNELEESKWLPSR